MSNVRNLQSLEFLLITDHSLLIILPDFSKLRKGPGFIQLSSIYEAILFIFRYSLISTIFSGSASGYFHED